MKGAAMTDIQVVRQTSVGYSNRGDSVYSTESFVKIEVSFLKSGSLRQLKGAPLSVFVCLALREADSNPGASLSTIECETGYSSPTVIAALRFLQDADHRFVDEIGTETDGTKRYRVSAYAWFGSRPKSRGGKISLPPNPTEKIFSPVVVDSDRVFSKREQQQQLFCAESKNFFHTAGIGEPALSKLAATVTPERAEMWCDWLNDPPKSFRQPAAYLVRRLSDDPIADPPGWTLALWQKWREEEAAEQAEIAAADVAAPTSPRNDALADTRYRLDGAGSIWHAACGELELQMTKTTFDKWLRPTRALGWDGDGEKTFVVGVNDTYAKEQLEKRLQETILRIVVGIVGHAVELRYEVT
jgi:hypothetical protein